MYKFTVFVMLFACAVFQSVHSISINDLQTFWGGKRKADHKTIDQYEPIINGISLSGAVAMNDLQLLRKISEDYVLGSKLAGRLLRRAVVSGWENSIAWLISRGADPAEKDSNGDSVLHLAVKLDCDSCIHAMLSAKNVELEELNAYGWTPAFMAVRLDKLRALRALAAYDANLHAKCNGQTPIMHATYRGSDATVQELLTLGVDPNPKGNSPLSLAISWNYPKIVSYLLQYGADPNCTNNQFNKTALQLAKSTRNNQIIKEIEKMAAIQPKKLTIDISIIGNVTISKDSKFTEREQNHNNKDTKNEAKQEK